MKKLKLGTRVLVNGVETFIRELHADMQRGVYRVITDNPTYEFTKESCWVACTTENKTVVLLKAPKYGNYQVGDRVKLMLDTFSAKKGSTGVVTLIEANRVIVAYNNPYLSKEGFNLDGSYTFARTTSKDVLKKLRVKLGE